MPPTIEYHFLLENGQEHSFQISLGRRYTKEIDQADHPEWTKLLHHRCTNCPLSENNFRHCPPAVDLIDIFTKFSPMLSYSKAKVKVTTPERQYHHECDVQKGLYSIVGLVMATSACPILSELRPLANFHLPFATPEETIFRTLGAYLVRQYITMKEGGNPDFDLTHLRKLYEDIVIVNTCFIDRIRGASKQDGNLNALVRLDTFSMLILYALKDELMHDKFKFYSGYHAAVAAPE